VETLDQVRKGDTIGQEDEPFVGLKLQLTAGETAGVGGMVAAEWLASAALFSAAFIWRRWRMSSQAMIAARSTAKTIATINRVESIEQK